MNQCDVRSVELGSQSTQHHTRQHQQRDGVCSTCSQGPAHRVVDKLVLDATSMGLYCNSIAVDRDSKNERPTAAAFLKDVARQTQSVGVQSEHEFVT